MNSERNFDQKISLLRRDYKASNNKSSFFFKNTAKFECANTIIKEVGINDLLRKTVYIIPNKNQIFLDYTVFKYYATPENYSIIVDFIIQLTTECIDKFGNYEVHVNLNSFSISAYERYRDIIQLFCHKCISSESSFCKKLVNMYIYNTPSVFQQISLLLNQFIDSSIAHKIIVYNKKNSEELIGHFYASRETAP